MDSAETSGNSSFLQRHRTPLVCALLLAMGMIYAFAFRDSRHDDAYITYRYGQNLVQGDGLVFNSGERILGSTAPGHILLSALIFGIVGRDLLPGLMNTVGCLAWMAQCIALFLLLRRLISFQVGALTALVAALGIAGSYHWISLETNLAVAFCLWAFEQASRGRWKTTALLAALAGLVRPDAYLVSVILGLYGLAKQRRALWKPALLFATVSAPWYIFATSYFGSPLPQSAVTKFQRVGYFKYLVHILEHTTENLFATPPTWVLIMLAWLLALAGAVLLARKAAMLLLLVLYGGAHFAAYLYLRPFTEHIWHLYPGLLIFSVCAVAALLSLLEHANRTLRWGAIIVLFSLATLQASRTVGAAGSYRTNYWNGARNQAYYDLSTFLRRSVPPEDVVATVEVGTIAYYSGLKMYDLGGLITLAPVSPQARAGLYRWLAVDGKYLHLVPGGARPVAAFRRTQFHVFLFDLAPAGPRR